MNVQNYPIYLQQLIERGLDEVRAEKVLKDIMSVTLSKFMLRAFDNLSVEERTNLKDQVSDEDKLALILKSQSYDYKLLFEDVFRETWDEYQKEVLQ